MPKFKYNCEFPDFYSDAAIELFAFDIWRDTDSGGLGRYRHFRNAIEMLWPKRYWSPWDDIRARTFCDPDYWQVSDDQKFHCQANVGCAASGKTNWWATAAIAWWMAAPQNSAVVITSIEKKMIRQRTWSIVQDRWEELGDDRFGNFVGSQMEWQATKGNLKHAVLALAVGKGETQKAVQRLAGIHPKRVMLVIDEAPGTPEAIYEAINNMRKGADEFVLVVAGNAHSRLDPHGRVCEPVSGWSSVDEDTEIWETRGVPEWSIAPGVCVHFHGKRSPNVKAKEKIYPGLFTYADWKEAQGKEGTLGYWSQTAGFWAPEGVSNTVFDEQTVIKCGGFDRVTWESNPTPVAGLDPAFGGDECVFRIGRIGEPVGNAPRCLEVGEKHTIKLKQKSPVPVHYQIARQVIDLCKRYGVQPRHFGLDCTGNGGGVAAILEAEWSPMIMRVEFGGAPSDSPVSVMDGRTCKEVYDRKISELCFNVRELLEGGQLKGLDRETVAQFCSRTFDTETRKKRVEKKDDVKKRIGRSPDDADCIAVMVEVARHRAGLAPSGVPMKAGPITEQRMKVAREMDEVYQSDEGWGDGAQQPGYLAWMED